jgi:hypothetical protein
MGSVQPDALPTDLGPDSHYFPLWLGVVEWYRNEKLATAPPRPQLFFVGL